MSTDCVTRAPNAVLGGFLVVVSQELAVLRWPPNMETGAVARQSLAA